MSGDDTRHGRRSAVDRLVTAAERRDATRSHTESVPCPFTPGCTGRTDYLTHDVFGTVERCRRCGKRQRITGRAPEPSIARPRQGVTPMREKGGRPRKVRVCSAPDCDRPPPPGRKTCDADCAHAAQSHAAKRVGRRPGKHRSATPRQEQIATLGLCLDLHDILLGRTS